MKIDIFTIRNKETNELIFAEGTSGHLEYFSYFELEEKWLVESEVVGAWIKRGNCYRFDEEVRHLFNYKYEKIKFTLEQVEIH